MTDTPRTGSNTNPAPPAPARPVRPGFVLYRAIRRPDRAVVEGFRGVPSANVSDVQGRQLTMHHQVKPIYRPIPQLLGTAVTVKARPGDNLMAMKAIDEAQPGDVLVISSDGEANLSVWGGVMAAMAVRRNIAGVVTDGLVRDVAQIRAVGLAVWATGLTPAGPTKDGPGQINATIACGNVVVYPGDIILGDEDGVVVIPRGDAETVLQAVRVRQAREKGWLEHVERGDYSVLVDTDDALAARGCVIEDPRHSG